MNTYNITYTDLTLWIEKQETVSRIQEVIAPSQEAAVEWFLENVQGDYDSIELEVA